MVSTRSLPPGGEAEIKATLRTTGISGPVRKQITVFTNDPANPRLVLSLTGEIVTDVVVKPRQLAFGEVTVGGDATREFSLEVTEPDRVRITGVTVDDPHFQLTRVSGDEARGGSYELRLSDTSKQGWLTGKVSVALTGAGQDVVQVPVTASVVGDLRYAKSFSMRRHGESFVPDEFTIQSRSASPISVLGVEDADGVLGVEIVQEKPDLVRLKLSVKTSPADSAAPSHRGKLVLRTTDANEPSFEVGYTVHFATRPTGADRRPGARRLIDRPAAPPPKGGHPN